MANLPDLVYGDESTRENILTHIPQQKPFRFIDKITELSNEDCIGEYTFQKDEFFYGGHFPGNPITPGVILIETMAQIGLIPIGIFNEILHKGQITGTVNMFLVETNVDFQKPVLPGDKVIVKSKKIYYKRKKLKTDVQMEDINQNVIAIGNMAGFNVDK